MLGRVRRVVHMGEKVSLFAHANPTTSATFNALLVALDGLIERAKLTAQRQIEGITQSRGASALRASLTSVMRGTHLGHLLQVATSAAQDQPEILPSFRLPKEARTIRGFAVAAGRIAAAAQEHRDLLTQHGLAETMIEDLVAMLAKYDGAVLEGLESRSTHVEATAELERIANEITRVVRVMDGFQQLRFARDPEKLTAWESARKVEERRPAVGPEDRSGSGSGAAQSTPEGNPSNSGSPASNVRPAA